jgi:hypothetical protein
MVYDGPEVHLDDLTLALKNMTCLSTLKLIHSQKRIYSSILQYCDAELHVFHCTYPVDRQFLGFLNRQDSIYDLALTGMPTVDISATREQMILPTSLPHLTEVSADSCFLKKLVPGRPVHTVRFKGKHIHDSDMRLSDFVDPSTVPVRNLGLDFMIWCPAVICCTPLSKDIEEITLTGFATQVGNTRSIYSRIMTESHIEHQPVWILQNSLLERAVQSHTSRRAKFKKADILVRGKTRRRSFMGSTSLPRVP